MSTLTPAQQAVLLERSKRLSVRPLEVGSEARLELLTFRLGSEWAALELSALTGILIPEITPLPDVSKWVLGIQSVRGQVVSVLDLGALLELTRDDADHGKLEARVLLLETPQGTVGFRVDAVGETRTAPLSALTPPVSERGGGRGVLEGRIVVLEAAGLLERVK